MIGRKPRVLAIASGLLIGALSLETVARAENEIPPAPATSPARVGVGQDHGPSNVTAKPNPAPVRPEPITITRQQLDKFAELVGEPAQVIWQRMSEDSRIVPLAIAAADARTRRQGSGRAMSIFGFVVIGVSLPAGLLATAALGLPSSSNDSSGSMVGVTILTVALLATVGGAAMAIAGNRKLREKTALETTAFERYRSLNGSRAPIPSPLSSANRPNGPGGNTVGFPVLSLSF